MTWIIDSSVAVKWVVAETGSERAAAFIGNELVAPDLLRIEVANVLWKKVVRGEITDLQAAMALAEIETLLVFLPTEGLVHRALEIALAIGHAIYDCLYLALAEATGIRIVTADHKLIRKCETSGFSACVVALEQA